MIGTIEIQNLKVQCIVGIHPHERTQEQPLFIDITIDYDFKNARNSEHVDDAIDYTSVAEQVEQLLVGKKYQLLETAAEEMVALLFRKWYNIMQCSIHLKKPNAIPNADFASIKILRKKSMIPT